MTRLLEAFRPAAAVLAFAFAVAASHPGALAQSDAHVDKHLYNEAADAKQQIAEAEKTARAGHKHILLEFGGNCAATASC